MARFILRFAAILLLGSGALGQESVSTTSREKSADQSAIDPVGIWSWEQRGGTNELEIKRESDKLTGSLKTTNPVRPNNGGPRFGGGPNVPPDIKNIAMDKDKISFDVERRFGDNVFVTNYAGVISGDEIAGLSVSNFGGQTRESAWMAKRVPASPQVVTTSSDPSPTKASDQRTTLPKNASSFGTIPKPMGIPEPGEPNGEAYQPRSILPGGIVMTLYPPDSPHLKKDRIMEVEKYSLSDSVPGRINSIVNIHNPSIEVHFASPSMNTGAVVILAAGGGHRTLNVGTESADFVPYFFNYGVNTVILRNRLRSDGYEPETDAVRDAFQAIRLVRKHAETWKFDPNRIGLMGFSAGAELSARTAVLFEQFDKENSESSDLLSGVSARPDFIGVIYPGPSPFTKAPETAVPRNTPPSFIACPGAGDRIHAQWATDYFSAMLNVGIPNVEMHIYGNGRHPGDRGMTGGLTFRQGTPFGKWQDRFIEWFDDLGFLTAPGTETKASMDLKEFVAQPSQQPPDKDRR